MTEDRKHKMLALIKQYGYIRNDTLARKLYTSTSTVRRNLDELEKVGLVKRSHGGVELANQELDSPFTMRLQKNTDEKKRIAKKASAYIKDDTVIFADASTTCSNLAPHLSDHKNIKVFTNGIELAALLAGSDVEVYVIGGKLKHNSLATVGENAFAMIDSLHFDAMFFSSSGYADGIISDYSYSETLLRRHVMTRSQNTYFLCDSSKSGKRFGFVVGDRNDVTAIITDP